MAAVTIYTTRLCGYCMRAKQLLKQKGVPFTEIPVDGDHKKREAMAARAGRRSVPQIWIGERHVGGSDELMRLERSGELDAWLQQEGITFPANK